MVQLEGDESFTEIYSIIYGLYTLSKIGWNCLCMRSLREDEKLIENYLYRLTAIICIFVV